jgi:hypothetical protein
MKWRVVFASIEDWGELRSSYPSWPRKLTNSWPFFPKELTVWLRGR